MTSPDDVSGAANDGAAVSPARLVVLTTGGTISCTSDRQGHLLPTLGGESLVRPIADRFTPGTVEVEVRELTHVLSASLTPAELDGIVAAVREASYYHYPLQTKCSTNRDLLPNRYAN